MIIIILYFLPKNNRENKVELIFKTGNTYKTIKDILHITYIRGVQIRYYNITTTIVITTTTTTTTTTIIIITIY